MDVTCGSSGSVLNTFLHKSSKLVIKEACLQKAFFMNNVFSPSMGLQERIIPLPDGSRSHQTI